MLILSKNKSILFSLLRIPATSHAHEYGMMTMNEVDLRYHSVKVWKSVHRVVQAADMLRQLRVQHSHIKWHHWTYSVQPPIRFLYYHNYCYDLEVTQLFLKVEPRNRGRFSRTPGRVFPANLKLILPGNQQHQ